MTRIGRQLLAESKRDIAENGAFEAGRGRDLLSLLVRANTSKEIPASQQLSDEDVIARTCPQPSINIIPHCQAAENRGPYFLGLPYFFSMFRAALIAVKVAGHETTR